MSRPLAASPSWEKEHLWLYLLALGFEPGAGAAAGKLSSHLSLGVNMFDKPNKDAFHVVARFLFTKLDHSRTVEVFRFCCPPVDKKGDAEFRKQCCEWLKKISDECGNSFPPVVASLFLSPGGPKFIHLMYHFARYVVVQHMKRDCEEANIHFPEAVNSRPRDSYKAAARYRVSYIKFLQTIQKEDFVIREYQRRTQLLTKQIRDPRSECAELYKLLQRMEQNNPKQNNKAERVQKVRSMWASVMETLTFLEMEKEVVDSVVNGHVDQYILDGTNVTINIPRLLLDKIETEMYNLHIGNVYEAGKLNLVTVIQLLNEALKILRYERQQVDHEALKLDLQYIEGKTKFQNNILLGLKSMRHKLKREDHVSVMESIAEKQRDWDMKWENFLGQTPFSLINEQNPVLDLLPAMSPLSFDPATEEVYRSSVFCQYPASIPDTPKKDCQANDNKREDGALESTMNTSSAGRMLSHLQSTTHSFLPAEPSSVVLEEDVHTASPQRKEWSVSQKILKYGAHKPRPLEAWKSRDTHVLQSPTAIKREDPVKKAQEQLAEEIAKVVVSESPQSGDGKGMDLDELIGSLASNPFLTRKQIPRTPENLITEIRSSWRKAIQSEDSSDTGLAQTEMVTNETPVDLGSAVCSRVDSSMACFMSSSHMSDNVSNLLEGKSSLSWLTPAPQKQAVVSHFSESPTQKLAIRMPDDERFWQQGLKHTVFSKSFSENPEESVSSSEDKNMNSPNNSPEGCVKTAVSSPYVCQNSSMHSTLSWDASQMVSGTSSDIIQFGILQETLPEEVGNLSLNSSRSSETDEEVKSNSKETKPLENTVKNEWTAQEHKLDLQSIRNRYEALKKTVFGNEADSFQPPAGKQFVRHRSETNLTPGSTETKKVFSPLRKRHAMDAEYIKTPSRMTLERRHTLSPLIAFSPVQERLRSMTQKKSADFLHNLNEEENLKEKLDAKESSDLKTYKDEAVSQLIEL